MSAELAGESEFQRVYLHPRFWLTWLGLGFSMLVIVLPFPVLILLGRWTGRRLYRFAKKRVHITRVNLKHCFPELSSEERESLVKANFESVGIGVMEVAMAWWWPRKRLEKLVRFKGLEHLKTDKGRVLLNLHFTTLEIGGAFIALRHSLDLLYRQHSNPVYEYVLKRQRQQYDPEGALLGRTEVRAMLKLLRAGRSVWYAPDQDYGPKQSVFAPFFGVQAATVTGTSRMAVMGRANVVPMLCTRLPGAAGYELEVLEAWNDFPTGDDVQDAVRLNQFIEEQIRKQPEQYMWLHRRFKTRPENGVSFY